MRAKENRSFIAFSALIALALASSGCAVTAASTGLGVAYAKGNLETVVAASPEEVTAAAQAALDDMGIHVVGTEYHKAKIKVVGRTTGGKKVKVKLRPAGGEATKLSIRVGVFGNQHMRHLIYAEVVEELPTVAKAEADPLPAFAR